MIDDDDTGTDLGYLVGLGTIAASAAALLWIGWLAWHAVDHQNVTDLLILAAIFIALPAWHMLSQAFEREKKADLGLLCYLPREAHPASLTGEGKAGR